MVNVIVFLSVLLFDAMIQQNGGQQRRLGTAINKKIKNIKCMNEFQRHDFQGFAKEE